MLIFVGGGGQWWAWRTTTAKTSKCVLIFEGGGNWWCWRRTTNENEHICLFSWVVGDSGPGQQPPPPKTSVFAHFQGRWWRTTGRGVEPSVFASKCTKTKGEGVEPSPLAVKHVAFERGRGGYEFEQEVVRNGKETKRGGAVPPRFVAW